MSDKKAIPLEKAIEFWEMRGKIKENLYTFAYFAKELGYLLRVEAAHNLIEKIDELEWGKSDL